MTNPVVSECPRTTGIGSWPLYCVRAVVAVLVIVVVVVAVAAAAVVSQIHRLLLIACFICYSFACGCTHLCCVVLVVGIGISLVL